MAGQPKAPRFVVVFTDGTSETFARRPIHMVRAERILPTDAREQEILTCWLWAAATGGKGAKADYEKWLDTVEEWGPAPRDAEPAEGGDADPLSPPGGLPD